jgi:glycosyltransferase involved in cell wall biosynthesis
VVVTAFNEEEHLERRLKELTDLLEVADVCGEIILVSDGSTDGTVARARGKAAVRVLELPTRVG